MTILDLTLLPLYRLNHQELAAMPGLLAMTAPRKAARGRETDRLVVYLVLTGSASFSTAEYLQLTSQTASKFFETSGALTSAMRAATDSLNQALLVRNRMSAVQGKYAIGSLVLAALRGNNCTMLQSGPTHVYTLIDGALQHTHDPALSGKGLGLSQGITTYFTQVELKPGSKLIFAGKAYPAWDSALAGEIRSSIEAIRRRLFSLSHDDLNAVIVQSQEGSGNLTVLRPVPSVGHAARPTVSSPVTPATNATGSQPPSAEPEPVSRPVFSPAPETELPEQPVEDSVESLSETKIQPDPEPLFVEEVEEEPAFSPSAYAIPPQIEDTPPPVVEDVVAEFPSSIPHTAKPQSVPEMLPELEEPIMDESDDEEGIPREPSETTRQVARGLISGMRASRRLGNKFSNSLGKFLPNLLPGSEGGTTSSVILLTFLAIIVPLLVVTAGSTAYLRFGRSYQFDNFYLQAENARVQAESATDPARQRDGWQAVLFYLDKAEFYRTTPESEALRVDAQTRLDELLGIQRLNFYPAFSSGVNAQISRLAANETDLYMLDAESGNVLHASQIGRTFQMDEAFLCGPGIYGDYQVGPIVDIQILPRLNSLNAAVVGIDAGGNLLYCAPGQVGQVIPLIVPDTNWGRVTGFTLDGNFLYVLDAPSRAIWVYTGQNASFLDRPFFYFGSQIPEIEDSIDVVINADELYLLHADEHISRCTYSRLESVPTRCEDPVELINPLPAYQGINLFEQAHITQIMLTGPPDSVLLLLDSDSRSMLRISPRSLELLNQLYPSPSSSLKFGPAGAMTFSPNRVLFMAVEDQVYFSTDLP